MRFTNKPITTEITSSGDRYRKHLSVTYNVLPKCKIMYTIPKFRAAALQRLNQLNY